MDAAQLRLQVTNYLTQLGHLFKPWFDTDFGTYEQHLNHMSTQGHLTKGKLSTE